ncbi:MAG TPA: hypothetical protein VH599_20640 [Ktedonobacterales bacterium]|jgi:hypothetical protein
MIPRSKQPNDPDHDAGSGRDEGLADGELTAHTDFSAEELALIRNLQRLFPLEQEQLPPRFVQTLAIEEGAWTPPNGLDNRIIYRVFRRLHLPRRLFAPQIAGGDDGPRGLRRLGGVSRLTALSTMLAMLVLSLIAVAPTFAQGLRLFLGKTGVMVVPQYPQQTLDPQEAIQFLSLTTVRLTVPFPVYWLGLNSGAYEFQNLVLHMGQPWADGPVVELQYRLAHGQSFGGLLVREFRPAAGATVLQVVAQGAAHPVQVGNQPAIFIDGQWVQRRQETVWKYGTKAELLYQANGLIFWITADQRDGAGAEALEAWAQGLNTMYLRETPPRLTDMMEPSSAQVASALTTARLGEVIALIQAGAPTNTGAAVYIALGIPPDGYQPEG